MSLEFRATASVLLLSILSLTSCATTFYEGAERPDSQGAVLTSVDTAIDEIDGKDVQGIRVSGGQYVLPPGPHVIGFSLRRVTPGPFVTMVTTSDYLRVCLLASRGHSYVTGANMRGSSWEPVILDKSIRAIEAGQTVPVLTPVATSCRRERLFGPVIPDTAPPSGPGAEPAAEATVALVAPTPPVSAGPEIIALWSREQVSRRHVQPFLDLMLSTGFSLGGDNLLTAHLSNGDEQTVAAGQGVFLSAGAMLTPLWLRDTVGLGGGAEIGIKYDDAGGSNARIGLARYPATATLHALVRTSEHWFVLIAGGVQKDLDVTLSGSGDASAVQLSFDGRAGPVARLGLYDRLTDMAAWTFGISYAKLAYDFPGGSLDASSFGFWLNVHLAL